MNVKEAFEQGKKIRAKQDEVIALFIANIRNVENMKVLEKAERGLKRK
jgi:hypothetical protein